MYRKVKLSEINLPEGTKDSRNQRKLWEYGYNAEHDIVVISKTGQIGEIIEIQNLKIALPSKPQSNDILFKELPKDKQKWQRASIPDIYEENEHQHIDFITQEYKKRSEGVWFYNNGTPTYITGSHYFFLQYAKIDAENEKGLPEFREPNRIYYIFAEACRADYRCTGIILLKGRRIGATTMNFVDNLNYACQTYDGKFGIVSKTNQDAKDVFDSTVKCFRNLPYFFKPMINGKEAPEKVIKFAEPPSNISKNNRSVKASSGLNTLLDYRATAKNSYDGTKLKGAVVDEVGKFPKDVDFSKYWYGALRKCFTLGRRNVGFAYVASTANKLDEGGAAFKEIYFDSNVLERNENGNTKSGLYSLFFKASDTLEGFYDEYGRIIRETPETPIMGLDGLMITQGSVDYLKNHFALYKGSSLLAEKRQFPESENDAFFDVITGNSFNSAKIKEQLDANGDNPQQIVRGDLMWELGLRDGNVVFKPNPRGNWHLAWNPPLDKRNNKAYVNGKISPANGNFGAGGCDSYDMDNTVDGKGSNGALVFKTKSGHIGDVPSDFIFASYCFRPPLAREFFEEAIKACVYFGMPLLIENNKYGIARHFEQRGYERYLLPRPISTLAKDERNRKSKAYGVPSSEDVIQAQAEGIQYWIDKCVGEINDEGDVGAMYFNDILNDWLAFKINDRTAFDLTVASGLAIMATQTNAYKKKEIKSSVSVKDIAKALG